MNQDFFGGCGVENKKILDRTQTNDPGFPVLIQQDHGTCLRPRESVPYHPGRYSDFPPLFSSLPTPVVFLFPDHKHRIQAWQGSGMQWLKGFPQVSSET